MQRCWAEKSGRVDRRPFWVCEDEVAWETGPYWWNQLSQESIFPFCWALMCSKICWSQILQGQCGCFPQLLRPRWTWGTLATGCLGMMRWLAFQALLTSSKNRRFRLGADGPRRSHRLLGFYVHWKPSRELFCQAAFYKDFSITAFSIISNRGVLNKCKEADYKIKLRRPLVETKTKILS